MDKMSSEIEVKRKELEDIINRNSKFHDECSECDISFVDLIENKLTGFNLGVELARKEHNTFQVKPCHEGKFKQFDCLESEDQYGFQTDEHDFRPAWHTWIDKKDCEKLHKLFTEKVRKEFLDKFTNGLPMTSMEATLKSKEFWLWVHAMINYIERELKQELGEIK